MKNVTKAELEKRIEGLREMREDEWDLLVWCENNLGILDPRTEAQRARWSTLYDAIKVLEEGWC